MPKKKTETVSTKQASEYYSYDAIMEIDAVYRLIIGQRSNGKTFGWCRMCIDNYLDFGVPSAYIRRLDEMIKPKIIGDLFNPHIDYIKEKTNGEYNGIEYKSNCFMFVRKEPDAFGKLQVVSRDRPFCKTYAISTVETTKGADHGEVFSVCFDEFITRGYYLQNEFIMYQNLLSSIIRDRQGVSVFMLANTVSKFCPYFKEMGLYRIIKQEQGTIDVYKIGKTGNCIAVEYCAPVDTIRKNVSKYFAFENPQLEMIQSGAWELALYRHAPPELSYSRVIVTFFVEYESRVIQGDVHLYNGYPIIFYHPKTTQIKNRDKQIIYSPDVTDGNPLHAVSVAHAQCRAMEIIKHLIQTQKTFYADNDVGETISSWLKAQRFNIR